ncbi:leucine-rich repeat-containing protein 3-like [Magallana gigas]|uniref:leucine-rich repeat-containing protein 3-like n=1 Tax=Magallana gigas TaxID=29159 RepID=UPI0033411A33
MGCGFKNRLVYVTYSMLWTVLLNTVFSDMTTVACPAPCSCEPSSFYTGTSVTCDYKGLKEVPTGIPKDTCSLDLMGNQISMIDNNTFKGLPQLKKLYLERNQISRIDNTFKGLLQLKLLSLNRNQITTIVNNTFAGLSQLTQL